VEFLNFDELKIIGAEEISTVVADGIRTHQLKFLMTLDQVACRIIKAHFYPSFADIGPRTAISTNVPVNG